MAKSAAGDLVVTPEPSTLQLVLISGLGLIDLRARPPPGLRQAVPDVSP
ncbi:MAG: hypothetical protein O7E50_01870 [Gemmatimonadetes bacterium]|nr:hypothetical protein [Gemmatimonadota bacterium]